MPGAYMTCTAMSGNGAKILMMIIKGMGRKGPGRLQGVGPGITNQHFAVQPTAAAFALKKGDLIKVSGL